MNDLFQKPAISKTGLDKIEVSPLDYWYSFVNPYANPYVPNSDTVFNEALRMAFFDPTEFSKKYVKMPLLNKRTAIGKSELANLSEITQQNNQILLSSSDYDLIAVLISELQKNKCLGILKQHGKIGEPTRFIDGDSGAVIKFRPHYMQEGIFVLDLATTDKSNQDSFIKEVNNFKLHKRAAIQLDGTGCSNFIFIRVEKTEPYKIGIHTLEQRAIEYGRLKYKQNAKTYAECLASDNWKGLSETINEVSLPEWIYR